MGIHSTAQAPVLEQLAAGSPITIERTVRTDRLTIGGSADISAPAGHELTLTLDGVEIEIAPGTFTGDVVLTVSGDNLARLRFGPIAYARPLRQAVFLDEAGIDAEKSVLDAASGAVLSNDVLSSVKLESLGSGFNGVYVSGGSYVLRGAVVGFVGDGPDDFVAAGAAVAAVGTGTRLVVDGATIRTRGVMRAGVVARDGSNVLIKDSDVRCRDGILPGDYVPNVDFGRMRAVPWMLGLAGNCRATVMLGEGTTATYLNSYIASENWGVLANDISARAKLTAINSTLVLTGDSGYGAYSLGGSTTSLLGCSIDVRDYVTIVDAGGNTVAIGASAPETVAQLNDDLQLGLIRDELRRIPHKPTSAKSGRFGFMLLKSVALETTPSSITVHEASVVDTERAVFLIKGVGARITVDNAILRSRERVILQVMDDDDPGPVSVGDALLNIGVFHEPTAGPIRVPDFDLTRRNESDVVAKFSNVTLDGDFYNAFRDGTGIGRIGGQGGIVAAETPEGKNLDVEFVTSQITGVISSTVGRHDKSTIGSEDYLLLGSLSNTPNEPVNNGVLVSLRRSTWTVTGPCYLTSLCIDNFSTVRAAEGDVVMTVDGVVKPTEPGIYQGAVALQIVRPAGMDS